MGTGGASVYCRPHFWQNWALILFCALQAEQNLNGSCMRNPFWLRLIFNPASERHSAAESYPAGVLAGQTAINDSISAPGRPSRARDYAPVKGVTGADYVMNGLSMSDNSRIAMPATGMSRPA
jgi:hypothetical protein